MISAERVAPCKYFSSYTENQSPLGSGMYWPKEMTDCDHPGFPDDEQKQVLFENYGRCDVDCPGYEPEPTLNCPKHGEYFGSEGCVECEYEFYKGGGWDDVVAEKTAIARIGFVKTLADGRPFVYFWSFCRPEGVNWEAFSFTPRELQRISEAYWKDKEIPELHKLFEESDE